MMLDRYLRYLSDVKNYSPETIRAYSEDLSKLSAYLEREELDQFKLNSGCARRFISQLSEAGLAKGSINRIKSSVSGYYKWLVFNKNAASNPFDNIKNMKKSRDLPDYLFENEIELLLNLTGSGFFRPSRQVYSRTALFYRLPCI